MKMQIDDEETQDAIVKLVVKEVTGAIKDKDTFISTLDLLVNTFANTLACVLVEHVPKGAMITCDKVLSRVEAQTKEVLRVNLEHRGITIEPSVNDKLREELLKEIEDEL